MANSEMTSLSSTPLTSKETHNTYSSEDNHNINMEANISAFWPTGNFFTFQGVKDVRINSASFRHSNTQSNKCLIIVSGRTESYLKYKELIFDVFHQGYDIFIMDHRGQGLSQRSLTNENKGYVESFQYYIDDLTHFINTYATPACSTKPFMLAHSMGGAIAATYLQQNPNSIKAAVLASPMLAIPTQGMPHFIAKALVNVIRFFEQLFTNTSWYFFGQSDFEMKSFEENQLMHSSARYEHFSKLYINKPQLQLGGVTVQWVYESLNAIEQIFLQLDKLKTPIIVLKAEQDTIVDTTGQDALCKQLYKLNPISCSKGLPISFEGAYHELFFETDDIRDKAIDTTLHWFEKHR